ncbi:MAG: hypothetical protein AOA66_1336 [Candidatus Bathyarchaeota archaeon BA2]|nr:MAG: hypothetical protein AOA66_1336 [Candidatus Bathyarchaeota archaeon BA2]
MAIRLVYYDPQYPTCWVNKEISKRVCIYFTQRGFKEVNANELAKIMDEVVRAKEAVNTVAVFAQDIAPATIAYGPLPDNLIRRYLDLGGRVVWIGDVPFFYQGHFNEKRESWGFIGERQILGVFTHFTWPLHVDMTANGFKWGLKLKWTGYRPAAPSPSSLTYILASSQGGAYAHAWLKNFNKDYPNSGFLRIWDYALHDISDRMLEELYNVSTHLLE